MTIRSTQVERHYVGSAEWDENTRSGPYVDGAPAGSPNAPVPKGHSPFYEWDAEQGKLVPIPGSPADR